MFPNLFPFLYFPLSRDLLSHLSWDQRRSKFQPHWKNRDCKLNQHMMLPNNFIWRILWRIYASSEILNFQRGDGILLVGACPNQQRSICGLIKIKPKCENWPWTQTKPRIGPKPKRESERKFKGGRRGESATKHHISSGNVSQKMKPFLESKNVKWFSGSGGWCRLGRL